MSRSERGYTLIELLVALALSALVALLGVSALAQLGDRYRQGRLLQQRVEVLRALQLQARAEWGALLGRVVLQDDNSATPGLGFDTLVAAEQQTDGPPPPLWRVGYRCEEQANGQWRLLYRAGPAGADPVGAEEGPGRTLADGLSRCVLALLEPGSRGGGGGEPGQEPVWRTRFEPAGGAWPSLWRLHLAWPGAAPVTWVFAADRRRLVAGGGG